jgi:hypothetical protein
MARLAGTGVTVTCALVLLPPKVAMMSVLPAATAVTRPCATVATSVAELTHSASAVTSVVVPSE